MNKKTIFFILSIFCFALTACSDSDDDNTNNPSSNLGDSYFTVNIAGKDYIYPNSTSNGKPSDTFGVMVLSSAGSDYDKDYGTYKGAALSITYNLQGAGSYKLGSREDLVENANEKYLSIKLDLGIGNSDGSSSYEPISGTADVTVKDGKYHISINEAASFKKVLTSENPVPDIGTPTDIVTLKLQNGYVK
jgi:hypothetical protein